MRMKNIGVSSFFYTHGILCASHPVEVLLACVTGAVCLLTLNIYDATHPEANSVLPERVSCNVHYIIFDSVPIAFRYFLFAIGGEQDIW